VNIQYARNGDLHIAYRVVGDGPVDLVVVAGSITNLEVLWENPDYRRFYETLGDFARVIVFDKRGIGLSDRVRIGTLEERMEDVRAVMDAAGSASAALMGSSEGGPMSMLFAATYPERTSALILCGAEVKEETTDDWPWGEATREEFEAHVTLENVLARWGQGLSWAHLAPSRKDDEHLREWWGGLQVQSASPMDAIALMQMGFEIDVRHVVPSINVPTLIIHRVGDQVCHVENGRWLARHIAGAKYVELPGADHLAWIDADEILAEVREFLTGVREPKEPDRVLATVLFTDIVRSTERAHEAGDRAWRDLLERHHTAVRHELDRFRGREVDTAGDGFFAVFDGPARGIRCARSIVDAVHHLGLDVRAGLHTGEVELTPDAVRGIAVHTGARVASLAAPGEVLVSGTVKDLIAGSGIELADRGVHELKGVPGEWRVLRGRVIGAAVVVWRRTAIGVEFLVLHRSHIGTEFAGDWAWGHPGGGCHDGETASECARRELREETGIVAVCGPTGCGGADFETFQCEVPPETEVELSWEHDAYRWLPLGEARALCRPALVGDQLACVAELVAAR
jgi:pimeloyl-ACP methyl ester carboxylesterase/8-oxo-dGTP pyrophosphatase MutT (NUDIX family)